MFEGINRGRSVLAQSVDLFRVRPRLLLLPLASLLLVGSGFAIAAGLALHLGVLSSLLTNDLLRYAAVFVGLALSTGLGTFFNAALVHCAARSFEGETPTLREGLAAAWRVRRGILAWSMLAATVGTVMYIAEERLGGAATLARIGFDIAWSLLTFFVVPVIVIEHEESVRSALHRSGSLFKDTWGESVTVTLGLGLVFFIVGMTVTPPLVAAYLVTDGLARLAVVVIAALVVAACLVATQALGMIARTALYRYAADGARVGPFTDLPPEAVIDE